MSDHHHDQLPEAEFNSPSQHLDPLKQEMLLQSLREKQQLGPSIRLGLLASIAGALIWAIITHFADRQIGWMAIGLGFGVAFTIRTVGQGIDPIFGYWSAGLSLLGCVLGNTIVIADVIANQEQVSIFTVLSAFLSQPSLFVEVMQATYNPMDLLFYALAIYTGYKYAFRPITPSELKEISS